MARKPPAPSPPLQAIAHLAALSAAGTGVARMERATRNYVTEWRMTADSDIARRWTETLLADIRAGLASAEEQAGDVDVSEPGAEKQLRAVVEGLRAAERALAGDLERM